MPKEFPRSRRVGEQLQRELATLVRDELRDPRVQGVTITGVDCAKDLSHARVHFSLLGATGPLDATVKEAGKALNGAAGALHRALQAELHMRQIPSLSFHYDDSLARGARIEALIHQALAEDAAHPQDADAGLPSGDDESE
jgi:ribosome-binding factor A